MLSAFATTVKIIYNGEVFKPLIQVAMPILLWFLIPLGLFVLWYLVNLIWLKPRNINAFYERYFIQFALSNPELLSQLGFLEQFGLQFHNAKLADESDEHEKKLYRQARRALKILRSYSRSRQTPSQLLSTDIMAWYIENAIAEEEFMHHDYPLNQLFGVQSELPAFMATIHRLETLRDARNYIKRLNAFDKKFKQILQGLRTREEKGITPPTFVVERVIQEMTAFIACPPRDNLLFTNFMERLSAVNITEEVKEDLYRKVENSIKDVVYPSYQALIDYYSALKPKTTTDDGCWKLPNGDRFYTYQLRSNTTTPLDAEEVHHIGLAEVSRILKSMTSILEKQGYKKVDVAEQMLAFARDPRFLYPNTDEGREQALNDYQRIIDHIDQNLGELFDIRPRMGVKVERIPEFREKTSAGAYYVIPSADGKRPGIFYANLRDMNEVPKFGMETLAYHEAIPGHHFQMSLAQELKGVPTFRRFVPFTAYIEGWALYAEKLAWENGFLSDPFSELGYLQSELFRAVRLVVDTGIHHKRWTRQQAIDYMAANTGIPLESVISEVERYIVMPGQACAYKIGEMKILELREMARKALGEKFDIRLFHNVILQNGAMPLELLEKQVVDFIARAIAQ